MVSKSQQTFYNFLGKQGDYSAFPTIRSLHLSTIPSPHPSFLLPLLLFESILQKNRRGPVILPPIHVMPTNAINT